MRTGLTNPLNVSDQKRTNDVLSPRIPATSPMVYSTFCIFLNEKRVGNRETAGLIQRLSCHDRKDEHIRILGRGYRTEEIVHRIADFPVLQHLVVQMRGV